MGFTTIPSSGAKLRASVLSSLITDVRPIVARKTIDETVVNNTFQNDDELFVVGAANTNYEFDATLHYSSGTTPDFRFQWTFPAGFTMRYSLVAQSTTLQDFYQLQTSVAGLDGIGGATSTLLKGVAMFTTGGTLQLQWAQTTTTASNTTVLLGSFISLRKIP